MGKLSKDQKADWLAKAFTWIGACLQLYKIGHHWIQPTLFDVWALTMLTHWLLFPHYMGHKKHHHVDHYVAELPEWLQEPFKEAQVQSTSMAERQKQYYDWTGNAISLEPGNLVLAKADAYSGRRKVKDWWEKEPYKVECQVAEGIPSYLIRNQQTGCSWVLQWNWLFLITHTERTPLHMVMWAKWARCTTPTLQ